MNDRPRGLYEVLITAAIAAQLRDLGDDPHAIRDDVRPAERYVKHESELPMAVTWRLDHALPGDLFAQFAAAVA